MSGWPSTDKPCMWYQAGYFTAAVFFENILVVDQVVGFLGIPIAELGI